MFAAFAEEWGFVGAMLLFLLYGIVFFRILKIAFKASGNFEILFGVGLCILFLVHAVIHIGMNMGLLPVTGNTLPFMSYGGSHLVTEFLGLGILMGMRKLKEIATVFINADKAETPAAIIQDGSLVDEKIGISKVKDLVKIGEENNLSSPAVIIIGEVVSLHQRAAGIFSETLLQRN